MPKIVRYLLAAIALLASNLAWANSYAYTEMIYPKSALDKCIEGYVLLEYTLTANQRVEEVTVLESEPVGVFEDSSRKALYEMYSGKHHSLEYPVGEPITQRFSFEFDGLAAEHCRATKLKESAK